MPARLDAPAPGTAPHVWLFRVCERAEALPGELGLLDATERARYDAFVHDPHRVAYGVAHAGLRHLLAAYTGDAPGALRFTRLTCPTCSEPHGRPALDTPGTPHFSLSHSGDLVMLAVAGTPVGADVEEVPAQGTADSITSHLHPREQAEITALPVPDDRRLAFARCWTRKEAYLKGTGEGLSGGTGRDYVGAGPAPTGPPGWQVTDCAVPAGHWAAIAVAQP